MAKDDPGTMKRFTESFWNIASNSKRFDSTLIFIFAENESEQIECKKIV